MTNSFGELAKTNMFLVIGSNTTEAHPVAAAFLKNAVLKGAQLIVVDSRKQPLVDFATLHVPIKVGSDIAFINGAMNVLITEDLYDRKFVESYCTGFDALKDKVLGPWCRNRYTGEDGKPGKKTKVLIALRPDREVKAVSHSGIHISICGEIPC